MGEASLGRVRNLENAARFFSVTLQFHLRVWLVVSLGQLVLSYHGRNLKASVDLMFLIHVTLYIVLTDNVVGIQ